MVNVLVLVPIPVWFVIDLKLSFVASQFHKNQQAGKVGFINRRYMLYIMTTYDQGLGVAYFKLWSKSAFLQFSHVLQDLNENFLGG